MWTVSACAGAVTVVALYACDDNTSSAPIDYTALLQAMPDDTAVPATAAAAAQADALVTSLKTLETANDAASLTAAQNAWRAARASYRKLDALHYGPVTDLATNDRVDTFPADPAAIATAAGQSSPAVAVAPNNAKGFSALETLLFSADGDAAALAALANASTRTYARLLGEDIAAATHAQADAWSGTFAAQLKTAGSGSTRYATQRAALDDLVGGVGYALELVVAVDLANPLGRKNAGRVDQTQVIDAISDNTVNDMVATLDGVSATYEGRGFTTLVRGRSAPLDDTFRSQLATCTSKAKALAPPFSRTLVYQQAAVQDTYDACKTAKTTWNTEVTSALGATVKPADNDGD